MRTIGRLLTILLALGLVLLLALWLWAQVARALPGGTFERADFRLTYTSFVYQLRGDPPSLFRFSRPQRKTRILTHADLEAGTPTAGYSLIIEALGADGQVVMKREIFLRSIILYSRDRKGRIVPQTFYADTDLVPSASDITLVEFDRPVVALRLRAGTRDAGVARIFARVQEQRPITTHRLTVGWERLSEREKRLMTECHMFPPEMLTAAERHSLLINRWYPVGPSGVDGIDYVRAILYKRLLPAAPGQPGRSACAASEN
jgi:hypothetical protein